MERVDERRELRVDLAAGVAAQQAAVLEPVHEQDLGAGGVGGMFGAFTDIAFTLTEVGGFPSASVPWLLVLFGGELFVGNLVGGRAADRRLGTTLVVLLAALAGVLAVFASTAKREVVTVVPLVLMGRDRTRGADARRGVRAGRLTLVSGATIAAFNVGNALGAWTGGLTIAGGLGFISPLWVGAAMTTSGSASCWSPSVRGGECRGAGRSSHPRPYCDR